MSVSTVLGVALKSHCFRIDITTEGQKMNFPDRGQTREFYFPENDSPRVDMVWRAYIVPEGKNSVSENKFPGENVTVLEC